MQSYLRIVFKLAPHKSSGKRTYNAMFSHLMSTGVACSSTSKRTHQSTVLFLSTSGSKALRWMWLLAAIVTRATEIL
jgi:hypothetical protein